MFRKSYDISCDKQLFDFDQKFISIRNKNLTARSRTYLHFEMDTSNQFDGLRLLDDIGIVSDLMQDFKGFCCGKSGGLNGNIWTYIVCGKRT